MQTTARHGCISQRPAIIYITSRTILNLAFHLSLQVTNRHAKDLPEMVIEAKDANVAEDVCEMGRVPRALEERIAAHKQLGGVVLKDGREHFVKVRLVL
jgi:hypothetical protein